MLVQHIKRNIIAAAGLLTCLGFVAQAQQLDTDPEEFTPTTDWGDKPASSSSDQENKNTPKEPMITFGMFSEAIELTTLIDYIGSTLNINIVVKGSPTGEIVFNAPVSVPRSKLINLLDAMLEQYAFTISYDPDSKFYIVQPITDMKSVFGTDRASTRIIPTPNIKPSLLVPALSSTLGSAGGTGANKGTGPIQAVDELGVLIINAPPRDIKRIEQMIKELIRIDEDQQYIRFELDHLAAPIALDRAVGLVGGGSASSRSTPRLAQNNPGGGAFNAANSSSGSLSNLSERMTIDPQGNALIFKGTQSEIRRIREILAVIDVPNTLEPRNYFAGSSAAQIADIAKRRGLGEVVQIQAATNQSQNRFNNFGGQSNPLSQQNNNLGRGGPVMVVDPTRGNIIYYGTDDQQAQLTALMTELKTGDERIVIREYVLNHTDALEVSDLLNGLISGQLQSGSSPLLAGSSGRNANRPFIGGFQISADGESSASFDPNKITVIPDESSNQIIIKAPIKQQEQLEKLIGRLDKQRSQVYIQAMIISVANNEDFTLAFETQLMAGQLSLGTGFGLSSPGAGGFTDPKTVASGLGGLTAAVIRSDYVPLIINASQTNTDIRILSTPQLLVNNNVESEIVSVSEQPFSTVTPGNSGTVASFGGFEEAGTTLRVTPSISDGGFIRLDYYVELSNFTSATGSDVSPPPRDRNTIEGSATVPTNATIVIGGITVEDIRNTVIKVPLLGDIPLLGELFKRTGKVNNKSKLYVFLTPRIMTDPNFNDLKLFSEGPQKTMGIDPRVPDLEPAIITSPQINNQQVLQRPDSQAARLPEAPNTDAPQAPPSTPPQLEPASIELTDAQSKGSE